MSERLKELSFTANAKLNLYLDITGRRRDGYHTLETVMQSIDLADYVTVRGIEGAGITVSCSNPLIPTDRRNICYKAAVNYFAAVEKSIGVEIAIDKRVPHAAGLGGGSADAAAVLRALNILNGNALSEEALLQVAAKTGADVPFCMTGGTKLCLGIGDELTEIEPFPERVYLVIMPDFLCDTKGAYCEYDKNPLPRRNGLAKFLKSGSEFPKKMYNVFRVLYENDKIAEILDRLTALGAQGAELSGSGAAVFGIFDDIQSASTAAREFPTLFTAVCRPVQSGIISSDAFILQ
ncbi:MAG: 4-(cytidine 5'-diphospho)-2-C-methyl-D-erythritol kinase [Oscillospiraceae bacterium]